MTWVSYTAGDLCAAQAASAKAQPAHAALVLTACILASSLAFVDGSVVNVGLPAIGQSLKGDAEGLQWVINAYLLPLSALLLLGGAAGDRFGRRRVLISGVVLFGVSSALCAAAPSLVWLLAARTFQGTGAALLLPSSLAILGNSFSGEARGRAVGTWSAASAIGGAIGPVLGGWLIDVFGWREIFLLNIPLAIGAAGLALVYIRDPDRSEQTPIDLTGAILAAVSLGLLTWGLTIGTGPRWLVDRGRRDTWSGRRPIHCFRLGRIAARRQGDDTPRALPIVELRRAQYPYPAVVWGAGRALCIGALRVDSGRRFFGYGRGGRIATTSADPRRHVARNGRAVRPNWFAPAAHCRSYHRCRRRSALSAI